MLQYHLTKIRYQKKIYNSTRRFYHFQ